MRDFDDIPIALRDLRPRRKTFSLQRRWLWVVGLSVALLGLALGALIRIALEPRNNGPTAIDSPPPLVATAPSAGATAPPGVLATASPDTLLGHLRYPEAPTDSLTFISSTDIKLRQPAADRFTEMQQAARADGVELVPLSGFRSVTEQQQIFFGVKAERNQTASERATVSAPPGYSEHHTGYAIDIGDGSTPNTNLSESFETTRAYQWLAANAARFNFEMSFPRDNPYGVIYEPWHWRYVGDQHSLEMFYRAKSLMPTPSP